MTMQFDPGADPARWAEEPTDPLENLKGAGPLLGQFEGFSERGARGTRSYKRGRLETIVLDGRYQQLEYDAEGRVSKVTTDDGQVSCRVHTVPGVVWVREFGALVEGKAPVRSRMLLFDETRGAPVLFGTEDFGWEFKWQEGRVSAEHGPRGSRAYTYDALGRLASWSDQTGKGVSLSRDGAATRHTLAGGEAFTLVQDAEGALREARQDGQRYAFAYEDGALRQAKGPLATLKYGVEGRRRSLESPWGKTLTQLEERSPRARWIETPAGTFRFEYEGGKRSQLSYPNGVVARYAYRKGRDLVRLESPVLDLERRYDERGLLAEERRDRSETPSSYGYNGFGSLTRVTEAGQTQTYGYDVATNRYALELSPKRRIADEVWSTLALRRRVLLEKEESAEGAASWQVKEVLRTYRSDDAGRLLEIKPAAGASDRFAYDGAGRLSEVQRAGGPKVRYAYDPLGRLASRTLGSGEQARVTRYVYDGPRLLAELGPGEALRVYAHGPDLDEPLAYRDGTGPWVFLHGDERGTVLAYSDREGQRVDAVRYSPFGVLLDAPEVERPLFFAGHRYDPAARLVLARARAYEPELNRFLGPDPAGVRDGLNPFLYAQGNPLSFVDPLGLWAVPSTVRSHYGTLSPRAQLLLLQGVNGLRMSPNPKAPLITLFKRYHPDVQVKGGGGQGETRTGRGSGTDLVERLALVETYEEAQALMETPLAAAARGDLSGYQFKIVQGVAGVRDDDERANDSELLRELLAPTPEEEAMGMRTARRAQLTGQFLSKYTDAKVPSDLQRGFEALVNMAGLIRRREEMGKRASEFARLNAVEMAEAQQEIDALAQLKSVSAPTVAEAAEAWEPITISEFARRAMDSLTHYSAPTERLAHRLALRARRKLWTTHEADLASPETLASLIERDAELKDLAGVIERAKQETLAADERVRRTEVALREALIQPLGRAEAWRRIERDNDLFRGVNTPALLEESLPLGRERALEGKLPLRPDFHYRHAKRPDYQQRAVALRTAIAKEKRRVAREAAKREAIAQAKADRLAARAKAKAKAKKRRGAPRGITGPGERVAPRPSDVSMAAAEPARPPRTSTRRAGKPKGRAAKRKSRAAKRKSRAAKRKSRAAKRKGYASRMGLTGALTR